MKQIRTGLVLALALLSLNAARLHAQETVDLVVVLDSSQSMFAHYDEVIDLVVSGIVSEYMRFGDTFHLISFAESTQIEIAQTLRTEQDLRSALARLYLLYPFGKSTDMITALRNTFQYVSDLPLSNRKFIVIITDGLHAPAAASPFAHLDADAVRSELVRTASRYREQGWTMRIITVPFTAGYAEDGSPLPGNGEVSESGELAPGAGNYLDDIAAALGASVSDFTPDLGESAVSDTIQLPRLQIPADLGRRRLGFQLPLTIFNDSATTLNLEVREVLLNGRSNILTQRSFIEVKPESSSQVRLRVRLPDSLPLGSQDISLELKFADNVRVNPAVSSTRLELYHNPLLSFFDNSLIVLLFVVFLVLAILIVVLLFGFGRNIQRRADGPVVETVLDSASQASTQSRTAGFADRSYANAESADLLAGHRQAPATSVLAGRQQPGATFILAGQQQQPATSILAGQQQQPAASILAGQQQAGATSILAGYQTAKSDSLLSGRPAGSSIDSSLLVGKRPDDSASLLAGTQRRPEGPDQHLLAQWSKTSGGLPLAGAKDGTAAQTGSLPRVQATTAQAYTPTVRKPGTIRVEMVVESQNRAIGKRNIKTMHAGGHKSVGGQGDDYLVFLLPTGHRIAEVYFDGEKLILVPQKGQYFPDLNGPVELQFHERVRVLSRHGREMTLWFEHYVPAADRINKLLHCIDTTGIDALLEGLRADQD